MKYLVRSLKYLVVLCVLYVALIWIMGLTQPTEVSLWEQLLAHLNTRNGLYMVIVFVVLAALYPKFGFMRSSIAECSIAEDRVRIDNAMRVFGFRFVEERDGVLLYRAEGVFHRLSLMFEDHIEVRATAEGVELRGIRRAVARVALQLRSYINNRRYEENNNEA